ncbi:MAG: exodeoxyribonuclease VII small subunit [Kiritimatiellae bacterium]|jgi:exodeoxyribonuclease VII small subunit|nr:exodeoxyribonuclease VII small subunit [Kiritimatiellia bacterium]
MSEEQKTETTFEQSLARLERIVSEMEGGTLPLDDMMKRFEEGRTLVAECTKQLEGIRQRIEKVTSAVPPAVEPLNIL